MAAVIMFANKYKAIEAQHELTNLERSLKEVNEQIRVANAEYAYLTRPAGLEKLVRNKLDPATGRLSRGKIVKLEQLAEFFNTQSTQYNYEVDSKIYNGDVDNEEDFQAFTDPADNNETGNRNDLHAR